MNRFLATAAAAILSAGSAFASSVDYAFKAKAEPAGQIGVGALSVMRRRRRA